MLALSSVPDQTSSQSPERTKVGQGLLPSNCVPLPSILTSSAAFCSFVMSVWGLLRVPMFWRPQRSQAWGRVRKETGSRTFASSHRPPHPWLGPASLSSVQLLTCRPGGPHQSAGSPGLREALGWSRTQAFPCGARVLVND